MMEFDRNSDSGGLVDDVLGRNPRAPITGDTDLNHSDTSGGKPAEHLTADWSSLRRSWIWEAAKRAVDLVVAAIGMVLAAPLALIIAVALRLNTPGPSFFRHSESADTGSCFISSSFEPCTGRPSRISTGPTSTIWRTAPQPNPVGFEWMTTRGLLRSAHSFGSGRSTSCPTFLNGLKGEMSVVGRVRWCRTRSKRSTRGRCNVSK